MVGEIASFKKAFCLLKKQSGFQEKTWLLLRKWSLEESLGGAKKCLRVYKEKNCKPEVHTDAPSELLPAPILLKPSKFESFTRR